MSATTKLEATANVSIIVSSALLCIFAGYTLLAQKHAREAQRPYQRGDHLEPVNGFETNGASPTLLLVIRSTCRFCNESIPFYHRLIDEAAKDRVRTVALMFDQPETGRAYVVASGLHVQQIVALSPGQLLRVTGTPTLILLDRAGTVVNSWIGKLESNAEDEVLNAVKHSD